MSQVFLSMGSNLGNRLGYLNKAIKMLCSETGCILGKSSVYETEPWGFSHENSFYNQVVELETDLGPDKLLDKLHEIEKLCGRTPSFELYTARSLDLDILFYDDKIISSEVLTIPHPLAHKRLFVLIPLNEIAPGLIHPVFGSTIRELVTACEDDKKVLKRL